MLDIQKIGGFVIKNERPDYADEKEKKRAEQEAVKTIGLCCRRIRQEAEVTKHGC